MSAVPKTPYLSPEEYLARERHSEIKHEYYRGEMFAMAGGSYAHSLIAGNLLGELHAQLKGTPCAAHGSDLRVKVLPSGLYTYPDLVVACAERKFEDSQVDTLLNPRVVGEVLSDSTEAYDRGTKAYYYRGLASLREFVLIAQDRALVEHYVRREGQWFITDLASLDDVLTLESIGCRVPLRQIYDRVEFPPLEEVLKGPGERE